MCGSLTINLLQTVSALCVFNFVVFAIAIPTDKVIHRDHHHTAGYKEGCGYQCTQQNVIPVSLAKQLSSINSFEQFLRLIENGNDIASAEGLPFSGINLKSPAQSSNTTKKIPPASCKPELRTISLKDNNDPTLIYYPMCIRLEQCGGCCNHELLGCQVSQASPFNVTIMMSKYVGNKTLKYIGKKVVTLIKHEMCKCDCKSQPKDCRGSQIYKKDECRCVCANETEEAECAEQPTKLWDPFTCQCTCRKTQECSSSYVFDDNSCTCIKIPEWHVFNLYFFRKRI